MNPKLKICVPLLDELDNLAVLLEDIANQSYKDFIVYFCVNQPDIWWDDEVKRESCERNMESISYLRQHSYFEKEIIDRATRGKGWKGKQLGVGWARKVCMDAAANDASGDDIMITLDGDTRFSPTYFQSVRENFVHHRDAVGLSVPYYHKLSGKAEEDRAILRYEIYMRNYAINLWRIGNPYSYTALGSAMALPVHAYKAIGGMTPKKSGEDFYFLQKLCKYGSLLSWNSEKVYPAARFSDRVFFGTGPAMIKGASGDWESYPVYHHTLFDMVRKTYEGFDRLFEKDVELPMDPFLKDTLGWTDPWKALRGNSKGQEKFRKACMHKVDGLRILQFLKYSQKKLGYQDESCLHDLFMEYYQEGLDKFDFLEPGFTFDILSIQQLDMIRNFLVGIEELYQIENHNK